MRRFLPRGFPRFPPQQAEPDEEQAAKSEPEVFYPSVRDVTEVRGILRLGLVPEGLPTEIVDLIIDTADYWPSVETKLPGPITVPKDGDRELVRTPPLCLEVSISVSFSYVQVFAVGFAFDSCVELFPAACFGSSSS